MVLLEKKHSHKTQGVWAKSFADFGKSFLSGFSNLQSTCSEEPFEGQFFSTKFVFNFSDHTGEKIPTAGLLKLKLACPEVYLFSKVSIVCIVSGFWGLNFWPFGENLSARPPKQPFTCPERHAKAYYFFETFIFFYQFRNLSPRFPAACWNFFCSVVKTTYTCMKNHF